MGCAWGMVPEGQATHTERERKRTLLGKRNTGTQKDLKSITLKEKEKVEKKEDSLKYE